MKVKCQACHGKGGYLKKVLSKEIFLSCFQCKGKGSWYPTKKANLDYKKSNK